MRRQMLAPAVLAAALAGSPVLAQTNGASIRGGTDTNLRLPRPGLPVQPVAPPHNMTGPGHGTVMIDRQPWQFRPGIGFVPFNAGGFQRRDQYQSTGHPNNQSRFMPMAAGGGFQRRDQYQSTGHPNNQSRFMPMAAGGFNNGGFAGSAINTPTGVAQVNPVTAQGVPTANAGGINTPAGASQINPATAQGVPNSGFVNGSNTGFNNGFDSFAAGGFVPGYVGPGWGAAVALPTPGIVATPVPGPVPGPAAPVLGINVPVQPIVGRPWNARNTRFVGIRDPEDRMVQARRTGQPIGAVPAGREDDRNDAVISRVAGSQQEMREEQGPQGEIRTAPADSEQLRLAQRVENIMENRPLREGRITAIGATGVVVRYDLNGRMKTQRFDIDQAFFFDENGRLATIASAPGSVSVGDRVMIPTEENSVRQAVAGSRQTTRDSMSVQSYSSRTRIRSSVAGSRQSTRNRRPAK